MVRTSPVVRMFLGLLSVVFAGPVMAADGPDTQWKFGWDGVLVVGRWMPVTADITVTEPGEYAMDVAATDAAGHTVHFPSPAVNLSAETRRLTGLFQLGRLEGTVTARVTKAGQILSEHVLRPGLDPTVPPVLKLSDRLFVVGKPRGLDGLTHFDKDGQPARVAVSNQADGANLPTNPAAYDGVQAVLLAGDQRLPDAVQVALLDWVRRGGRLIVSIPKDVAGWSTNPLRSPLPVDVKPEPYVVRELGSLEIFAGRNVRIPIAGRLAVARLEMREGQVLAGTREEPLLVSAPLGFGDVTVLALDLTQAPLANWGALADFTAHLLKVSNVSAANSRRSQQIGQLTTTGITDMASQMVASQDYFPGVRSASPWVVMGWMLLYIAIVGPVDYLLVHYVFRRPAWTWITVLVSAIGFGWIATQSVYSASVSSFLLKQVDVVDIDVAGKFARHRTWAAHHAPATARIDWDFAASGKATRPLLSPFAAPESTLGGMYRAPGSEWGRTDYTVDLAASRLEKTPVLERSTQSWLASWVEADLNVVDSDLRADGLGRLTGRMTQHFSGTLHQWMLVFGNRVYRLQDDRGAEDSLPWSSGTTVALDDARIYQRELRGLLTGSVARLERREQTGNTVTTGSFRNELTRYDPQERDPLAIWRMITFHTEAGGDSYTSLSNELLQADDLSRQLALGRAVLFGRLEAPSSMTIKAAGETVAPTESTVIVRLILPVGRSTELPTTLPKLVE
ncbi:MAG TPA: hypothetical protein VFG20_19020 [Planctomycetaceae bacterium]|nr:hypothetical protein [Planctomycetaceae bacterium]